MSNTLALLKTSESSPPRRPSALTQTNSRTNYGGKLYGYAKRFSVGAYPNRSQEREPETQRFSRELYHDGEGWKLTWHSDLVNQGTESPAGLVNSPKSSQGGSGYRRQRGDSQGITPEAKRRIANMVMGLHHEYGRERVGFGTCTVPNLPPDELAAVNRAFPDIFRKFAQRCKREAERCGVPWLMVAAYEIQEKRLDRWGQVVLHVHFVFVSRAEPDGPYWLTTDKLTQFWGDALENFLGHDVPRSALTNVQASKGNTGRELAKYQSKGSQVVAKAKELGKGDELPGQWWSASKAMKELDAKATFKLSGHRAEYLLTYADDLKDAGAIVYRPILKEFDGRERCLGIAGFFLNDEAMGEFLLATADDQAVAETAPITIPRIAPTPDQIEGQIALALAQGDFAQVQALVDQADSLYPHPDQARREMAVADSLYICDELEKRRERQRPKDVYGYNRDDQSTESKARCVGLEALPY
ncbi:hypothetical protein [Phormidium sp. FACHB-1136]|uniref:hypothetical protein n=1 Tax=Phormidium sp. FACHB-1136 TaxID=2692848 RepID=UPI0016895349|nr:hypothetical protein [Phormidium sp. FACHB-1136]MBD2429428.1 hypothetical protein [Phormidium sp. FACHB-1136]